MYALYEKTPAGVGHRYLFKKRVSLFKVQFGFHSALTESRPRQRQLQPLPWHVNMREPK